MPRLAHWILPCLLSVATAQAEEFWIGEGDEVFGEVRVVEARFEDTFVSLARTHNVGFEELKQANPGVDAWLPGAGTKITIPTISIDSALPINHQRSAFPIASRTSRARLRLASGNRRTVPST